MVKPKGQKRDFETVRLPNYLRRQKEKEMELHDNYFDEVTKTMKADGKQGVSDFLMQLKNKKEEIIRQKKLAEMDEDEMDKKKE